MVALPLLIGCGRSELFGEANGGLSALASGGSDVGSAGNGSGRSATSAGVESNGTGGTAGTEANGTAGSGATSAGQGVGGFSSGSNSSGRRPTGTGTSAGRTSGTGGSVGTGRSSGTGGTGSNGTGGEGPMCDKSKGPNLQAACKVDSDCGCPYTCVNDPPKGMNCEPSCLQLTDCGDLSYVCNGTYCQFNACGPGTGNGAFNSFCDVNGTDDGTCLPFTMNGETVGECLEGGTSTTCCDGTATRTGAADGLTAVCVAGAICSGGGANNSAECGQVCDPTKLRQCPPGMFCATEVGDEITGGCFAPPPGVCSNNQ